MAILNFIKSGTYTKISSVGWSKGKVLDCEIEVFESKPDKKYANVESYEQNDADGSKSTHYQVVENQEQPFTSMNLNVSEVQSANGSEADVKKWSDYFEQSKWSANGSDLHCQLYKWMLTLDMFDGCSSDE